MGNKKNIAVGNFPRNVAAIKYVKVMGNVLAAIQVFYFPAKI